MDNPGKVLNLVVTDNLEMHLLIKVKQLNLHLYRKLQIVLDQQDETKA